MTTQLDSLRSMTVVVADTGDIDAIKKYQPQDATTNPSLILSASALPQYAPLIDEAIAYAKAQSADKAQQLIDAEDKLAVNIGLEILKIVPGRISTEVDARLSYDTQATVEKARKLIALYNAAGISNDRILIKIASTWQGIRAAEILEKEGITFVTNTEIGKNYPAAKIMSEFDAVVLCCGATKARDLVAEGREETKGIHFAVDFLKANTKSLLDSGLKDRNYISAEGKDVIIIGGGDTGTDCCATSIRHGCKSVTQIEIMPEAPEGRTAGNPWPQWPRVKKTDYGQEESIFKFGKDPREYLTTVKKVVPDEKGNIKEVHTVKVEWKNENGRMIPHEVKGSEKVWPCQLLLIAMGFTGPEDTLIKQFSLDTDNRGNVKANEEDHKTSTKGIFVAGDMRRGQSLVVWAIHEGREAAKACDAYLNR